MTVRALTFATLAAAALVAVTGCASSEPEPPVTVTVTAEAPDEPDAVTPSAPEEDAAAAPAPTAEPAEVETFVVPDVVGQNLQYAQDTLQALGSYVMDQEDASGLDRFQIDDSNWQVCSQSPVAGTTIPIDDTVTLWSVKLGEACP